MKTKLLHALAAFIVLLSPGVNFAQAPDLGTTSTYALFTAVGAFNNIGAATTVTGDVGTNVGAFNAFPPGILVGQINVANSGSAQAAADVDVAYGFLDALTCGTVIGTTLGSGQNLTPDVYCLGAASTLNGDLILDGEGDPSSLFIFKIDGALATTVNSRVILTNSASICNVYWQVNGQVDLGNNSLFQGTLLVNGAIHLLDAATLVGRGLSRSGAISLQNNVVTLAAGAAAATITASGPTTFCAGASIILSGNVGGTWSNGATTSSITVKTAGDYFTTSTNGCGAVDTSNHITVTISSSICTLTGNSSLCVGESIEICAPFSDSSTYLWSTGATTNCITVSAGGKYSVTVTNADGCKSTCSKTVTTTTTPSCSITGKETICEGSATSLCATYGKGYTYLWSNGATSRCISVKTAGAFSVTVTKDEHHSNTCTKIVAVTPAPPCLIEGSSFIVTGGSTQLCAPPSASSTYLWSTGATTNCITVSAGGVYSVSVTNEAGCATTCKKTIKVTDAPCPISGPGTVCEGGSSSLCAPSGTGYAYLWSTGATSRCITITAGGTYSLTLTKNGSAATCSKTVTVGPLSCGISGSSTICAGGSTSLCAPSGTGYTYLWSNGATTRCITVTAAGTPTVTVTKDGCSSTCSRTVKVSGVSSTIAGNSNICEGNATSLCGPTGYGYTYLWSTGATSRCLTVITPGAVSLTVTAFGCSSTGSTTVTANNPICSIAGDLNPGPGETTTLCAPSGLSSYKWNTGATTSCITVDCSGTYTVVTDSDGCISSCNATVTYSSSSTNTSARTSSSGTASVGHKISGGELNLRASTYPNPFYATAIVEFQNTESKSHIVVELFSFSGDKVATLFNDEVEQGALHKVEVNAGDLPSGIYICRITNGYQIINRKLKLVR